MKNTVLIGAAGLLAVGAWLLAQDAQASAAPGDTGQPGGGDVLSSAAETVAQTIDRLTGGSMKLSAMANVTPDDVNDPNVQALLRVIRTGEGTNTPDGYRTLFGGGTFDSYVDHPRQSITRLLGGRKLTSTAAGAYQFLSSTWDETARIMGLTDFSPASQDMAAVGRLAARGALDDAKAGRFDVAIAKAGQEWASMPGSPYGQPVISLDRARSVFASYGGSAVTA